MKQISHTQYKQSTAKAFDTKEIEANIKNEATTVLLRVALFIAYYTALILIGIALFAGAFFATYGLVSNIGDVAHISIRGIIYLIVALLAMWWFCIQIAGHLVGPLFTVHKTSGEGRVEVTRKDCPELFDIIVDIAKSTGNKMPKHVYLSAEVNAYVFYDSTSFWSIFFPSKKNLTIGLGLLYGMNIDEVKAILGHEFGHFSQQTMRIGSVSYRLLLIIRDMIKNAEQEQQIAESSKESDNWWDKYFHLASGPISLITRWTIAFYKNIELRNRKLSRFMEFEADNVACRAVGAKPFISALYKLQILTQRYSVYERVIADLLTEKRILDEYWKGYEFITNNISKDEQLQVTNTDILESPIGDAARHPSRVRIVDVWDTHPTTGDRIANAMQFIVEEECINTADPTILIPHKIKCRVGQVRQRDIAEHLEEPVKYSLTAINYDEFVPWADEKLQNGRMPHFIVPFVHAQDIRFEVPPQDETEIPVESPFTIENREALLDFHRGMDDLKLLDQLSSNSNGGLILYDGTVVNDIQSTIEQHLKYLDLFVEKARNINIQTFKYLYQKSGHNPAVSASYWSWSFGDYGLTDMRGIIESANSIMDQARPYLNQGKDFMLDNHDLDKLTQAFWEFMQSFDYENVVGLYGEWENNDGVTISQKAEKWYAFSSAKESPNISPNELLAMIYDVYHLLEQLYSKGRYDYITVMEHTFCDIGAFE